MVRLLIAMVIAGVSVVTSVIYCWKGQWATGMGICIAGLTLASQCASGWYTTSIDGTAACGYGFAMVIGVGGTFIEHRLFEAGRTEVQTAGLMAFASLEPEQCTGRIHDFTAWQHRGTLACATQNLTDQMDVVQTVHKAQMLPGELTLADGIYQMNQPGTADQCVTMLKELVTMCPHVLLPDKRRKLEALKRM